MDIADGIQLERKTRGLSQEALANAIGVSRQAVSKWESEQSSPELDKIILLSDYFSVSTDYLLKGTEFSATSTQHRTKKYDAKLFTLLATVINLIGFLVALILMMHWQTNSAVLLGAIIMVVGCAVFFVGQSVGENKSAAKKQFWLVNVWILSIMPLSCISGFLQSFIGRFSIWLVAFPQMYNSIILYLLTWIVYFVLCIIIDFYLLKKKN